MYYIMTKCHLKEINISPLLNELLTPLVNVHCSSWHKQFRTPVTTNGFKDSQKKKAHGMAAPRKDRSSLWLHTLPYAMGFGPAQGANHTVLYCMGLLKAN